MLGSSILRKRAKSIGLSEASMADRIGRKVLGLSLASSAPHLGVS